MLVFAGDIGDGDVLRPQAFRHGKVPSTAYERSGLRGLLQDAPGRQHGRVKPLRHGEVQTEGGSLPYRRVYRLPFQVTTAPCTANCMVMMAETQAMPSSSMATSTKRKYAII